MQSNKSGDCKNNSQQVPLMPLVKQGKDTHENAIGYTLNDYLELLD